MENLWHKFANKVISQWVSGRMLAYISGNGTVIWLSVIDRLEKVHTFQLLEILFVAFFGVKGIEWVGNSIKSISFKKGEANVSGQPE